MKEQDLIQQYLLGNVDDDDVDQINRKLAEDQEFRKQFADLLLLDCSLRDIASQDAVIDSVPSRPARRRLNRWAAIVALAASLAAIAGWLWFPSAQNRVAVLETSEGAAWVSDLPTSVGSELSAGELRLVSGIATLRFDSGASMVLEAPAEIELQTKMRAFLHHGAAIVDVPASAIGFVVETPNGDAIDLGTSFSVNVESEVGTSEFEVLEGIISVGRPGQESRVLLKNNEAVFVDRSGITEASTSDETENVTQIDSAVRVKTNGHEATFVRGGTDQGSKQLLMVKSSWKNNSYDRKAVFSFDASDIAIESSKAIRLRLNQVDSDLGFANRLPPINVFQVYALADAPIGSWDRDSTWNDAPSPEDGVLVGEFEIARSRKAGECVLESKKLTEFVRSHSSDPLTFVVVRETKMIPGDGKVLVHAFASHSHPSAVGPTLEFEMEQR